MSGKNIDINVDLSKTETIKCPSCECKLFEQKFILKRIPKFMVGSPTDVPAPIPIWRCSDCGEILKEFMPPGVGTFEEIIGDEPQHPPFTPSW